MSCIAIGVAFAMPSAPAQDALNRFTEKHLSDVRRSVEELVRERKDVVINRPYRDVRANLHVHSALSHDSRMKIEDILQAAHRAGTEVLMFTEHVSEQIDFFLEGHSGVKDGILLVPGAEMKGLLVYPTMSMKPFADADAKQTTEIVRTRGGHVFLSHLEERMEWEIPALTGTEIYNTHADFKKQKKLVEQLKNPLWLIQITELIKKYPQETLSALQTYPEDYLKRWDELSRVFPHTGIAANDAHQNVGIRIRLASAQQVRVEDSLGEEVLQLNRSLVAPFLTIPKDAQEGTVLFEMQLDPYEKSLRHVGTHLLVKELTREEVWDALENQRAYVAFDWMADAKGFDLAIQSPASDGVSSRFEIGAKIPYQANLRLIGKSPQRAQWRVLRDGKEWVRSEGDEIDISVDMPGIYRIELWLDIAMEKQVWILTNPFFVSDKK